MRPPLSSRIASNTGRLSASNRPPMMTSLAPSCSVPALARGPVVILLVMSRFWLLAPAADARATLHSRASPSLHHPSTVAVPHIPTHAVDRCRDAPWWVAAARASKSTAVPPNATRLAAVYLAATGGPMMGVRIGAAMPTKITIASPPGLLAGGTTFQLLVAQRLPDGSTATATIRVSASLV